MANSDDEDFVTFGSALEALDEDNLPRKKTITIEDQYALDAQGRRRFHGAFTGGFSAGYFNSVGTRDGWKPQQFKSSRSSKAGGVSQRVEDFMDDEDTDQFGIAPTLIRANSAFADHGRKGSKRELPKLDYDGPIPGIPVLKELLKPVKDTVGVTLLKKMGWRPGQGIGSRIPKHEKAKVRDKNERMRIYGCSLPNQPDEMDESSSGASEDECGKILFAPDDYEPLRCNPKDNYFGIGYTGLDRRPVLSGHINLFETPSFKLQDKNKKLSIRGQAFGVGAFEADDEDIYQRDDMSRYDFALGPSGTKTESRWSRENDGGGSKKNCPDGFVAAKKQLERKKIFEAPELPKEFKAFHVVRKSRFQPLSEPAATSDGGKRGLARHDLNASERAFILGDASSSGIQNASVEPLKNDYEGNSEPTGSRVAHNVISRTLNLHGKHRVEERRQQETQRSKNSTSWFDKLTSKSFVKGGLEGNDVGTTESLKHLRDSNTIALESSPIQFSRPFPTDSDKQRRFDEFVELTRRGEKEKLSSLQPLSMTVWEREHEREEFDQGARLYEKFVIVEDEAKIQINSDDSNKHSDDSTMSDEFVPIGGEASAPSVAKTVDDRMKSAAKMNLFGKLTREREPWQPASLVCKRFNIPEPRTGCAQSDNQTKNKRYSVFHSLNFDGSSARFERATDTPEAFKELHIPYKPKKYAANHENDSITTSRVLDVSDINIAASRSTVKIRSFEACYEKIFGRGIPVVESSSTTTAEDLHREIGQNPEVPANSSILVKSGKKLESSVNTSEKKDLFKAIFLSSSEDSDSDIVEDADDSEAVKSLLIGKTPGELNVQRNDSPPRGIFAKLDLDSFIKPGKVDDRLKPENSTREDETAEKQKVTEQIVVAGGKADCNVLRLPEVELLPDMYGPVLPSKIVRSMESSGVVKESSSKNVEPKKSIFKSVVVAKHDVTTNEDEPKGTWVERVKFKKSKKEKHKHKHKQKERSRHKHKKTDKVKK